MPKQTRHVASVPSPEARANVQAVPKGNVWRRHGRLERVLLGEFGNGMVEPPVYGRRQQRLWMRREEKQPSSSAFEATA